ncbi:MAG: hypothetical protein RIE32_01635 [Phycisphaerales bacterium]
MPSTIRTAHPRTDPEYRKRQVVLDERTDTTLQQLTETMRRVTGTRLTTSHAVRALLRAVEPSLPLLATRAVPAEATFLPNNAPRFADHRIRYEQALTRLLSEALRSLA